MTYSYSNYINTAGTIGGSLLVSNLVNYRI